MESSALLGRGAYYSKHATMEYSEPVTGYGASSTDYVIGGFERTKAYRTHLYEALGEGMLDESVLRVTNTGNEVKTLHESGKARYGRRDLTPDYVKLAAAFAISVFFDKSSEGGITNGEALLQADLPGTAGTTVSLASCFKDTTVADLRDLVEKADAFRASVRSTSTYVGGTSPMHAAAGELLTKFGECFNELKGSKVVTPLAVVLNEAARVIFNPDMLVKTTDTMASISCVENKTLTLPFLLDVTNAASTLKQMLIATKNDQLAHEEFKSLMNVRDIIETVPNGTRLRYKTKALQSIQQEALALNKLYDEAYAYMRDLDKHYNFIGDQARYHIAQSVVRSFANASAAANSDEILFKSLSDVEPKWKLAHSLFCKAGLLTDVRAESLERKVGAGSEDEYVGQYVDEIEKLISDHFVNTSSPEALDYAFGGILATRTSYNNKNLIVRVEKTKFSPERQLLVQCTLAYGKSRGSYNYLKLADLPYTGVSMRPVSYPNPTVRYDSYIGTSGTKTKKSYECIFAGDFSEVIQIAKSWSYFRVTYDKDKGTLHFVASASARTVMPPKDKPELFTLGNPSASTRRLGSTTEFRAPLINPDTAEYGDLLFAYPGVDLVSKGNDFLAKKYAERIACFSKVLVDGRSYEYGDVSSRSDEIAALLALRSQSQFPKFTGNAVSQHLTFYAHPGATPDAVAKSSNRIVKFANWSPYIVVRIPGLDQIYLTADAAAKLKRDRALFGAEIGKDKLAAKIEPSADDKTFTLTVLVRFAGTITNARINALSKTKNPDGSGYVIGLPWDNDKFREGQFTSDFFVYKRGQIVDPHRVFSRMSDVFETAAAGDDGNLVGPGSYWSVKAGAYAAALAEAFNYAAQHVITDKPSELGLFSVEKAEQRLSAYIDRCLEHFGANTTMAEVCVTGANGVTLKKVSDLLATMREWKDADLDGAVGSALLNNAKAIHAAFDPLEANNVSGRLFSTPIVVDEWDAGLMDALLDQTADQHQLPPMLEEIFWDRIQIDSYIRPKIVPFVHDIVKALANQMLLPVATITKPAGVPKTSSVTTTGATVTGSVVIAKGTEAVSASELADAKDGTEDPKTNEKGTSDESAVEALKKQEKQTDKITGEPTSAAGEPGVEPKKATDVTEDGEDDLGGLGYESSAPTAAPEEGKKNEERAPDVEG